MSATPSAASPAAAAPWSPPRRPIIAEFLREQLPIAAALFVLALLVSYLQYGFLPGSDRAFPVAQVRVSVWHLVGMGLCTGYAMALVGQASGVLSLAYSMSILNFTSVSVSATSLVTTFINPFGALLGFRRGGQWNLDLARWLCVGALIGAPLGPFLRMYVLSDPRPFKALLGLALAVTAAQLWIEITPWFLARMKRQRDFKARFDKILHEAREQGRPRSGLPSEFRITTLERSLRRVRLLYGDQEVTLGVTPMVLIGMGVAILGAALGNGGGFLLVPILVIVYGLPLYVVVAASVPFSIVLSFTGMLAYTVTLPLLTGRTTPPDWAFALFVAVGATLGAWLAAKTQRYIREGHLKLLLGAITGTIGTLYIINYFHPLPFPI